MKKNSRQSKETTLYVILTITGEVFTGFPEGIVTQLRQTSLIPYPENEGFMKEWSERAQLFTKSQIDPSSAGEFIKTNCKAGLMKLITLEDMA